MKIDDRLLKILVCPETRQPLTLASAEQLCVLNERITSQTPVSNRGGTPLCAPLEALLIREDQRFGYPVREGVPELLVGEAIPL